MHDQIDPVLFAGGLMCANISTWLTPSLRKSTCRSDRSEEERKGGELFPVYPHIEPMLIISTAHPDILSREHPNSSKGIVVANSYGWIVYTRQQNFQGMIPPLDFAAAQSCLWIKFDADGPEFNEFPILDCCGASHSPFPFTAERPYQPSNARR